MISKTSLLLLAVSITGINAARLGAFAPRGLGSEALAMLVPQDLSARSVNLAGGWSLSQTSAGTCPSGSPVCGASWCCPDSLACYHTGSEDIAEACCPSDADCTPTFTAAPICADLSWNLYNATFDTTDKAGYFCCLPGQVGLQTGVCIDVAESATAGPIASQLGTGTGSAQTAVSTATVSTVSSAVTTTTASSVAIVTSTKTTAASTSITSTSSGSVSSGSANVISSSSTTKASTTASITAVTTSSPVSTSSPATSSVAVVTGKSGATGSYSVGGTSLAGAVAAFFAFALL